MIVSPPHVFANTFRIPTPLFSPQNHIGILTQNPPSVQGIASASGDELARLDQMKKDETLMNEVDDARNETTTTKL